MLNNMLRLFIGLNGQSIQETCDPEVHYCDSEIPLNGPDQRFSPAGLKHMGNVSIYNVVIPAFVTEVLLDNYLEHHDLPHYYDLDDPDINYVTWFF